MKKGQDLKHKRLLRSAEILGAVIAPGGLARAKRNIKIINLTEIITPQPYGVFALCKLYEYLQRN